MEWYGRGGECGVVNTLLMGRMGCILMCGGGGGGGIWCGKHTARG